MRRIALLALAPAIVLMPALPSRASGASSPEAARRGAAYIASRQEPDGGFFIPAALASDVAEDIVALVAGDGPRTAIDKALGYVAKNGPPVAKQRGGRAGKIVLGLVAAGADPRSFAGTDYVAILRASSGSLPGSYDDGVYSHALAMLGMAAAGVPVPDPAVRHLRVNACPDGGFGFDEGCVRGADTDTTAMVLDALTEAGVPATDGVRVKARAWLAAARNGDGGFGRASGKPTNANSTGLTLSAIAAIGEDARTAPWSAGGADPLGALLALQMSSGGFHLSSGETGANPYATVQAVPGVAGFAYPVHARPVRSGAAVLPSHAGADGSPSPSGSAREIVTATVHASPTDATSGNTSADRAAVVAQEVNGSPDPRRSRTTPLAVASALFAGCAGAFTRRIRRKVRA